MCVISQLVKVLSTCSFLSQWHWWMHYRTYYQRMDHGDFKKPRFDSIHQISHQRTGLVVWLIIIKLFLFYIKPMKLFEESFNFILFYRLSMNGLIVLGTGGGREGYSQFVGIAPSCSFTCTLPSKEFAKVSYWHTVISINKNGLVVCQFTEWKN